MVLTNQAIHNTPTLDPGSDVDGVAELAQRRFLLPDLDGVPGHCPGGRARVAKAVLISAVPPLILKTEANPGGLPREIFDGFQAQVAQRSFQFYREFAAGPFYGYNRPGAEPSEGIIENWWRQGMMGGAKAHYDGIVAFSQTDFTDDLKKITVPVLVMHPQNPRGLTDLSLSKQVRPDRHQPRNSRLP